MIRDRKFEINIGKLVLGQMTSDFYNIALKALEMTRKLQMSKEEIIITAEEEYVISDNFS